MLIGYITGQRWEIGCMSMTQREKLQPILLSTEMVEHRNQRLPVIIVPAAHFLRIRIHRYQENRAIDRHTARRDAYLTRWARCNQDDSIIWTSEPILNQFSYIQLNPTISHRGCTDDGHRVVITAGCCPIHSRLCFLPGSLCTFPIANRLV